VINRFKSFIREHELFKSEERVLLAISGGVDSMVMAELFHEAGVVFGFVHCNFKLRGKDSDEDEAFVRSVARSYDIPVFVRSFDTQEYAASNNVSVQMAARELRYDFFEEIAQAHNYQHIATAHHLDDQTETFFINLLRGCGIAGLHGIKARKGRIIRPLLFATRKEIEAYARGNEIKYRIDHTNEEKKYIRNKIRHEVIPSLTEINPDFQQEMDRNISRLRDVENIYRREIERLRASIMERNDKTCLLDIKKLKKLQPLQTILFEMISEYGFRESDTENILSALDGIPGKTFYSENFRLLIDREMIIIEERLDEERPAEAYYIADTERFLSVPFRAGIKVLSAVGYQIPNDKNTASLDYNKLQFPLHVRRWKTGDFFFPLGMQNRKKLSDLFVDLKYSRFQKENAWVMCSDDDIVWVVGERIDNRYKVDQKTEEIYQIVILPSAKQ
jgi:tRNA(Ile)-lysidine synthase